MLRFQLNAASTIFQNKSLCLWAAAAGIGLSVLTGKCLSMPLLNSIHNHMFNLEYLLGSIPCTVSWICNEKAA